MRRPKTTKKRPKRNARLRRRRERRWQKRAARGTPPSGSFSLERSGIEVSTQGGHLRIRASDYHAGPLHLSSSDLKRLGLRLAGDEKDRPPSVARKWAASVSVTPDRARRGPALAQPGWSLPKGIERGEFLLARVRRGLDVFALGYEAAGVELDLEGLKELKLAFRGNV